jgi:hypothetical protein
MQTGLGVVSGRANRKVISLRGAALLYTPQNIVAGVNAFLRHRFLQAGSDANARLPAKFSFCAGTIELHVSQCRFDAVDGKRDWAFDNLGQKFETDCQTIDDDHRNADDLCILCVLQDVVTYNLILCDFASVDNMEDTAIEFVEFGG